MGSGCASVLCRLCWAVHKGAMGRGRVRTLVVAAASAAVVALSLGPVGAAASSTSGRSATASRNLLANVAGRRSTGRLPSVVPPRRPRAGSPQIGGPVSDNVQVSSADNNAYSTTAATYDPTNHSNLFAGANMLSSLLEAGFSSPDGGSSWSTNTLPLPGTAPNTFDFDPGAAYDASGSLYFSSLPLAISATNLYTQVVV